METKKLMLREERKIKEASRVIVSDIIDETWEKLSETYETSNQHRDDGESAAKPQAEAEIPPSQPPTSDCVKMRIKLPTAARISDQHGVSDRCVAAAASATLYDVGLVTKEDLSLVIDRSKTRRELLKERKSI